MESDELQSPSICEACCAPSTSARCQPKSYIYTLTQTLNAALVGYVEYPVVGLVSGLAPLSTLAGNATTPLDACIVPGTGPASPLFSGRLVRLLTPS